MGTTEWVESTDHDEMMECLNETDGTMSELIAEYIAIKDSPMIPIGLRAFHLWNTFELMLDAAKDYHDKQAATNTDCPTCNDNGMYCNTCGRTGKRQLRLAA